MQALKQLKSAFYMDKTIYLVKNIVNSIYKFILNFIFALSGYIPIKPLVVSLCFLLCGFQAISQSLAPENGPVDCRPGIHRINLGVKAGLPGIISAGTEVVTPLLQNRVAPFVEVSRLKTDYEAAILSLHFLEYGVNLYFSDMGRKGYLAVSRSSLTLDGIEEHPDGVRSETNFAFQGTNVKIGGRWGKRIYFRMEAGFTFGQVPEGLEVTELTPESNSITEYEAFPESVTTLTQMGLPVFNIGMGISL